MTVLQRTTVAAARLLLGLQNLVVTSAGFALLSTLPLWAPLETGDWTKPWVEPLQGFHLELTVVFLVTAIALFWLHLSWSRRARRSPAADSLLTVPEILLGCGAALLPIWVAASSAPWLSMWTDGVALLESMGVWQSFKAAEEMSGLFAPIIGAVLMIPGLQLATATSFLIASSAVLLLLAVSHRQTTNALLQCLLVQGAFLIALYSANDLAERLSHHLLEVLSSATETDAAGVRSWIQLAFSVDGFASPPIFRDAPLATSSNQ